MEDDESFIQGLFDLGRLETLSGNFVFDLDDLKGRKPEDVESLFYEYYKDEILDIEIGEDYVDVMFALYVCPNAILKNERCSLT